jgi:hypothetical protein
VQAPPRTALSGPTLVRLLARFAQADVPEPRAPLSDRLSEWLGWTDAITLSTALASAGADGAPARVRRAAYAPTSAGSDAQALATRARGALVDAIAAATRDPSARKGARNGDGVSAPPPDYADFRQRYQSLQQAMESDIGDLRQRLRATLAALTPGMARLATVDAVMERSLGARERTLLAAVPTLLGAHFERLRGDAQAATPTDAADEAPAAPDAWLRAFRNDMQSVLLAELDVRFQPVEGLLAALRAC